jgi:exo-beta-1,3-glucanase (GH17 family)
MNVFRHFGWQKVRGICYSGFREGQRPGEKYPSYEEVKEDLLLLEPDFGHLRMYDCDEHAKIVLEVIKKEGFPFKVLQGAYIEAEMNNFGCPWGGGVYGEHELERNKKANLKKIKRLADWANRYPDIIIALSVGNEACVDWSGNYVPVHRVIEYVQYVKGHASQPVTFCDNYVPWLNKLKPLVEVVDFISLHTYPVWEYKHIHEAMNYTVENYEMVAKMHRGKPVVITEAGWATNSNGRGIHPERVNEEAQKLYFEDLMQWTDKHNVLTYFFEAFDEPWKGSPDPNEPEKHWGLYKVDRSPKLVMKKAGSLKG